MIDEPDPRATAARYDRWAGAYATVVRRLPIVGRYRDRAVGALDLARGDRVLDVGCGPGVNLDRLHGAVGAEGTTIGLDASPRMLRRARRYGPPAVAVIQGDARRPPVRARFDGLLATFVVTLFADPDAVVSTWWELLEPGGRLALLNMAPVRGPLGAPLNLVLDLGLALTSPDLPERDLVDLLDRRISTAHGTLADLADRVHYREGYHGALRLAVGCKTA